MLYFTLIRLSLELLIFLIKKILCFWYLVKFERQTNRFTLNLIHSLLVLDIKQVQRIISEPINSPGADMQIRTADLLIKNVILDFIQRQQTLVI